MNHLPATRALALVVVLCMLAVGGVASAQAIAHDAHHAHHQKASHGTVLCSWMCAAGQALDGVALPAPLELVPVELASSIAFSPITASPWDSLTSRAPPVV